MPSYASIESVESHLDSFAAGVGVFRYHPGSGSIYEFLPNIRILEIVHREGPEPGLARFSYVFDGGGRETDPWLFQQVLSFDSPLPGVIQNDERLVVLELDSTSNLQVLFDGFAQVPELRYGPNRECVEFVAHGVSIRAWDRPVSGCIMRNSDDAVHGREVTTDLFTRFNPSNVPNATAEGYDAADQYGNHYPVFLDPLTIRKPDVRRHWNLSMAVKYLIFTNNGDESYVRNPDPLLLDTIFTESSPGIQSDENLIIPDYCATGRPWPMALHELLKPHGFGMGFSLNTNENGEPITRLRVFRVEGWSQGIEKDLFLQSYGEALNPSASNLMATNIERNTSHIINSYILDTALTRYEASFILSPGFEILPLDSSSLAQLDRFSLNSGSTLLADADKYRLYIFDETGDGHWNFALNALEYKASLLNDLFGSDIGESTSTVRRRRIPFPELLTLDAASRPLKAQLSVSTDYAGSEPGIWDGTGTWQIVLGGYELLRDRLGVWVNVANPNGWNIGASKDSSAPYPAGVVRSVEALSKVGATQFTLRLTCVIEGDHGIPTLADRRGSSPTVFTRQGRIDARSRYLKSVKSAKSEFNMSSSIVVIRDDESDARTEVRTRQITTECGIVSGTVVVPYFTLAYEIGDRIRSIQGRNLSLRTNAGAPSIESEVYPTVIGRIWDFNGRQSTVLQLSDLKGAAS